MGNPSWDAGLAIKIWQVLTESTEPARGYRRNDPAVLD
ncbi:hypothetical protein XA26_01060 [Mycolicibacterium fortuitum]|uniref:Uncharacterized protein n=1 Tax=Mycolicibacterium fortuitum TaxID=1766 RepID=A0A0N9XKS5_MYCFO|nr:hypothetical protein G155_00008 [Mycobacterium sp. VKM Ac-1817D]ALI23972.1 hypothetical protein XA26_01060 [Mycolicibacterium fortuitum]